MAPKTKINLKERLEDGELDLSLSDLQEVPVRDIALMKKATSLDLSNNRLTSLGKNFVILTQIVKLDLSKNLLTELPEDFGMMKQLKHLDLYSNQLTHLPLSFHQLKALRWLDLKNNPLVPALEKVAGPCLDGPQCIQCARNIVTFFTQMNDQIEVEKQRREKQRQAKLEAEEAQQKQIQKKKEKKKEKKPKKVKTKVEKGQKMVETVPLNISCVKKPNSRNHLKKSKKQSYSLFKLMFYTAILSLTTLLVLCSLETENSIILRLKVLTVWDEFVKNVPLTLRPWVTQLGNCVHSLHMITAKCIDILVVNVNEIRKSETFVSTVQAVWDMLKVIGAESKKLFISLGDQAIIWTNEVKKKII